MQVMLFGGSDTSKEDEVLQVTVAFNNFGKGLAQRMPRCRFGFFHVVNNDYTHWEMYAIGGSNNATIISQGNRYIAPPEPRCKEVKQHTFFFSRKAMVQYFTIKLNKSKSFKRILHTLSWARHGK